jgi:ubiquinone/menaquinone biosynthesis C-methylase UbiE
MSDMAETGPQQGGGMGPEVIMQMSFSHAPARILSSAVQLGLFSHLAEGKQTAREIASAAGASERGVRMLLDALAGFQLLKKTGERYELTPLSAEYLVRDSPNYLANLMETDHLWEAWGHLTEVVRKGKPLRQLETQGAAEQFFPILVRSLHVANREPARRTAEVLGAGTTHKGMQVIDVACGSGVWGIGIAEADSSARVTAQDFAGMLEETRLYLKRHGVEERFDFLPGDLKETDFGEGLYDLALLGNIVHSEGEASSRDLFRRLFRALKPGGRIVIVDMIPNDERTGPPFPLIFAVNMLLNTEEGGTYTLAEYTAWLSDAGFARVETAEIGSHSPLVIGIKE